MEACYGGMSAISALSPRQGRQNRIRLSQRPFSRNFGAPRRPWTGDRFLREIIDSANNVRERAPSTRTLSPLVLRLQDFPGPLAFTISNYDTLTPSRTLFTQI